MKLRRYAVVAVLVASAGCVYAQTTANGNSPTLLTDAQAKRMRQEARTPDQFKALSVYFASRQADFAAKAASEYAEWTRRSQNIVSIGAKYPRPVDSSRYRYEYFTLMAAESGQQATRYSELSREQPATGVQ